MPNNIDPGSKNVKFPHASAKEHLLSYSEASHQALKNIDGGTLEKVLDLLTQTVSQNRRVYVAGNGGSASIADHLCCDFSKGAKPKDQKGVVTHSLASNVSLFSAIANDFGYERTFSDQIEMFGQEGDVLILISSSGNSANIVKAAQSAKEKKMTTIGFTGFSGGTLKDISDLNLHVGFNHYGVVEDCHQMIMHSLAQGILSRLQR